MGNIGLGNIYYSVDGAGIGADIFRSAQTHAFTASGVSYASASALGLQSTDQITGLTVVDRDGDANTFSPGSGDAVVFSLGSGSPSLSSISITRPLNGNLALPADVFVADASGLSVLIRAEDIGLRTWTNSDALDGLSLEFELVPEPGATLLLLLGGVALGLRRARS